jgi:predicted ATP-dependent endonuclease of OLD family
VPLAQLHLARENESGPGLKALREAAPAEHKFFELHARASLIDGLYASVVVLGEGPTERGAFPVLWASHRPGDGLDEHRIELVDCESIDKMPSFVRFFKELGIPVIAVADADQPQKLAKVAGHSQRPRTGAVCARCAPSTKVRGGRRSAQFHTQTQKRPQLLAFCCTETFSGRYWARTSDLRLVEAALSQLS